MFHVHLTTRDVVIYGAAFLCSAKEIAFCLQFHPLPHGGDIARIPQVQRTNFF